MNVVADECVDGQIVSRLRAEGHDVSYIAEQSLGLKDESVLAKSQEGKAVLLTADKDFGDLIFRQHLPHSGVILLRLAGIEAHRKAQLVAQVFAQHPRELHRGFAVLTEKTLRIRTLIKLL